MKSENHRLATTNESVDRSSVPEWLLKSLGEKSAKNFIMKGGDDAISIHWSTLIALNVEQPLIVGS